MNDSTRGNRGRTAAQGEKPQALPVCPDLIPADLKELPRWVVWRYIEEEDPDTGEIDWDKPPVNPRTSGPGSSTTPKTWAPYDTALAAYQRGGLDGVGFVLDGSDDLVGVDLDKCRDAATGAVEPWALEIVRGLDTYTEASPSGRGLRLFLRGKLPPHGRKKGPYENYSQGRYVTVTGQHLGGTPLTIEHRGAELLEVHRQQFGDPPPPVHNGNGNTLPTDMDDAEIVRRAGEAKNGARFRALWNGSAYGFPSSSEADLALVNYLAFWCGSDPERIDALFRQSGLFRSKWNREDYRDRTIRKALAGRREFYERGRHPRTHRTTGPAAGRDAPAASTRAPGPVRTLPPFRPFPVVALPGPLDRFVTEAAEAIGCDPAYVALPLLSATASAVGNSRTIRLKRGWDEPCIVWSAIIGDSGTLKSPAYKAVMAPLVRLQRKLLQEHKGKAAEYQTALAKWRGEKRDGGESEAGDKPEEPGLERVYVSDITIERLAEVLEDNPRGVLVARDELSGWLGSFGKYKGKQGGSDLPNWLEMWSAGAIQYDRKTGDRRTIFVPRAAASVTGGIQPGTLARALTPEFLDAGLAARLLLAMPDRRRKKWTDAELDPATEKRFAELFEKLRTLPMRDGERGDKLPVAVKLDSAAKATWVRHYDHFAGEQEAAEGEIAAALSKLEAYAARLALLHYAVRSVVQGLDCTGPIPTGSLEAGIVMAQWFAHEARRIYAILSESEDERDTRRLVEFIRSRGGSMSGRDLQRANGRKYPTVEHAEAALDALVGAGLARWEELPANPSGGRHRAQRLILRPTSDKTDKTPGEGEGTETGMHDETSDETP
jgi:hypothetical protein